MRIIDWSSDVCSSDRVAARCGDQRGDGEVGGAGEDDSHGRGDWGLGIGDSGNAEARKSARGAPRLYRIPNTEVLISVLLPLRLLLPPPLSPDRRPAVDDTLPVHKLLILTITVPQQALPTTTNNHA